MVLIKMLADIVAKFNTKLKIEYFILNNFNFINGENFKNIKVEYTKIGCPITNNNNEIVNAILYFHGTGETCTSLNHLKSWISKDKALDPEKYFVIAITTLGTPGSFAPSNSDLRNDFPEYTLLDMVKFQKEFIYQKFNITHLKGLIGYSLGGSEVLTWVVKYPQDLDFIILINSTYGFTKENHKLFKSVNTLTKNKSIEAGNKLIVQRLFSIKLNKILSMFCIDTILNKLMVRNMDANDIILRNNVSLTYNLKNMLKQISIKTLIIATNTDQLFPPESQWIPFAKDISNFELIIFHSKYGHASIIELNKLETQIKEFLN
jgi:homoserine O-acetyltransferase